MKFRSWMLALLLGLAFALSACQSGTSMAIINGTIDPESADELITFGDQERRARRYDDAAILYGLVEQWFPLDPRASDAQLLSAWCYYQDRDYEETLSTLARYIFLHPAGSKTDYAYYLRALVYFDQIPDVQRDQDVTKEALEALNVFIELYPDSQYTPDARVKRTEVRGQIAGQEMVVGRYYLSIGDYLAAYNRFQVVIEQYSDTNQTPEAYYRMVETTLALGLRGEAFDARDELRRRYPENAWSVRADALLPD